MRGPYVCPQRRIHLAIGGNSSPVGYRPVGYRNEHRTRLSQTLSLSRPLRIGILGGTFDPIHNGHLAIAAAVLRCLNLDRVMLIPAGKPWLKAEQHVTSPGHRLAMTRLAVEGRPGLEVSSMEVDRPGATYTVDTLAKLRHEFGEDVHLYLILGMDSIRELRRWRQPETLFAMCTVVAVSRPDSEDVSSSEIERDFPAATGRTISIRGPMLAISATEIRRAIADGRSISDLMPSSVERYIQDHQLYPR